MPIARVRIVNEVSAVVLDLADEHMDYLYNKYAVNAPNYFFNPKYKLGQWDGKIRFFHKTGKTFLYLLDDLLPRLVKLGYKIALEDLRTTAIIKPKPITTDLFNHITHIDTGEPTIIRQYQVEAINSLIEHGYGVVVASTGSGKAQPLSAKVMTPMGWKLMGDIVKDDIVRTPSGTNAKVLNVFPQGEKDIYEVIFHDGAKTQCCLEHLWTVNFPISYSSAKTIKRTVSLEEIKAFLELKNTNKKKIPGNVSISVISPYVPDNPSTCPVDPYLLGLLLGDGCLAQPTTLSFSSADAHIVEQITLLCNHWEVTPKYKGRVDYALTKSIPQDSFPPSPNKLVKILTELQLMGTTSKTKFIPQIYKQASVNDRLLLIRGLLDTNGTVGKRGNVSFTTTSKELARDLQEVLWSVGALCSISVRRPTYTYKNQKKQGAVAYTLNIAHSTPALLFSLPRKINLCRQHFANARIPLTRRVKDIRYVGKQQAQCIFIDSPDHLYITDDYIITHNTLMCAALVHRYGEHDIKSLTIVPNRDLIRQTKNTYQHYGLDVGEYSGERKTLNHQHIVSTWQALKNTPELITLFNMVIVDECHGLKGNVLSNILTDHAAKIPYRFGFTGSMPKEKSDAWAVYVAVGPIRYEVPASELIEKGVLARPHIDILQLQEDLRPEFNAFLEECIGQPPTYNEFKEEYFPDFSAEKSYLQYQTTRLSWIAQFIEAKRDAKKGNVLCLVDNIAFGRKLVDQIEGAIFVNGQDVKSPKDRKAVYDMFADNDNLVVIATVHIAGTGIDIHRIFNLMFIDIGKSFIRVIQAIGRGLRKADDKDKISITDICSDLKYSKKHLRERIKFYKEAVYPYKHHKITYQHLAQKE